MTHQTTEGLARMQEQRRVAREERLLASREEIQDRVSNIIGWSLNSLQFHALRQALADYERCEMMLAEMKEKREG